MNSINPNLNRSVSSSNLSADKFQTEKENSDAEPQGTLRSNKFSFSHLFRSIATRPQTPSTHLGSPSIPPWTSRVSSFVGSLFDRAREGKSRDLTPFVVEDPDLKQAMIFSSPETIRVGSSTTLGFDSLTSPSIHSSPQEATLPQCGFFQAGDQDRKNFVASLMKNLEQTKASKDPEEQLRKDIDRMSYLLNGTEVNDIPTIKAFLGEAAESILPILSQTIPNLATDIVSERILKSAPFNTVHAELAINDNDRDGTTIRISKKEEEPKIHIEVESIGTPDVFFKKVEREETPDFELITIDGDANDSSEPKLSGEVKQFIALELTKDDLSDAYSMSCSKLLREYKINSDQGSQNLLPKNGPEIVEFATI